MNDYSSFQRAVLASTRRLLERRSPVVSFGSDPIEMTGVSLSGDRSNAAISLLFRVPNRPDLFGFRFPVDDRQEVEGWSADAWASVLLTNWEEVLATRQLPFDTSEDVDGVTWID